MPTAPFDTIETILDAARTRLNDAIQSLSGEVLTDNAPFTTQMVNNAWRRFQRKLAGYGYTVLEQSTFITGLPSCYTVDAGVQVWIDWTGYFNGNTLNTSYVLPQWFISPLKLQERINGGGGNFLEMDQILLDLPHIQQGNWNRLWEWKDQRLYMPGSTTNTDLYVRGQSYLADFTDLSQPDAGLQPVPIVQVLDPLANYVCAEMASSRGDIDAKSFVADAESGTLLVAARDTSMARSLRKVSEAQKMADRLTPGQQPAAA